MLHKEQLGLPSLSSNHEEVTQATVFWLSSPEAACTRDVTSAELVPGGPHAPGPHDQCWWQAHTCVTYSTPREASARSPSKGLLEDCLTTASLGIKENIEDKQQILQWHLSQIKCLKVRIFLAEVTEIWQYLKGLLPNGGSMRKRDVSIFKVTRRLEFILFKKCILNGFDCVPKYPLPWEWELDQRHCWLNVLRLQTISFFAFPLSRLPLETLQKSGEKDGLEQQAQSKAQRVD